MGILWRVWAEMMVVSGLGTIGSSNRGGRQITKQDCGKDGILWCPQAGRWPPVTLMLGQSSLFK